MLTSEIKGDIGDDIFRRLGEWQEQDPFRLAQEIRGIMIGENERFLKAGIDVYDQPMDPVKPSTIDRGRGGFGPPLIPRFDASWPIARFEVAVAKEGTTGYLIRAGWPGVEFAKYHQTGTKHMAARPIAGFRDSTNAQIDEATDRECRRYLDGQE